MRSALLAGVALATVFAAGSASAADLSVAPYKSMPVAAPSWSWTGCYVGGHAGGVGGVTNFGGQTWGAGGAVGGQVGCNYQIDHFVIGVESEGFWSNVEADNNASAGGFGTTNTTKNPWTFDVAARAGLAYDRFFIYDKTGIAFGRFQYATNTGPGPFATSTTGNVTSTGIIQGLGLEYMITPWLSAKAEFDVMLYSSANVNFTCAPAALCGVVTNSSTQPQLEGIGKIGFNYKFW
jgi:outer membrane immunogenic protein